MAKIQLPTTRPQIGLIPQTPVYAEANPGLVMAQGLLNLGERFSQLGDVAVRKEQKQRELMLQKTFSTLDTLDKEGKTDHATSLANAESLITDPSAYMSSLFGEEAVADAAAFFDMDAIRREAANVSDGIKVDVAFATRNSVFAEIRKQGPTPATQEISFELMFQQRQLEDSLRDPKRAKEINADSLAGSLLNELARVSESQGPESDLYFTAEVLAGKWDFLSPNHTAFRPRVLSALQQFEASNVVNADGTMPTSGYSMYDVEKDEDGSLRLAQNKSTVELIDLLEGLPDDSSLKHQLLTPIRNQLALQRSSALRINSAFRTEGGVTDDDNANKTPMTDTEFSSGLALIFSRNLESLDSPAAQADYIKNVILRAQSGNGTIPESLAMLVKSGMKQGPTAFPIALAMDSLKQERIRFTKQLVPGSVAEAAGRLDFEQLLTQEDRTWLRLFQQQYIDTGDPFAAVENVLGMEQELVTADQYEEAQTMAYVPKSPVELLGLFEDKLDAEGFNLDGVNLSLTPDVIQNYNYLAKVHAVKRYTTGKISEDDALELGQAEALDEIVNAGYLPIAGRLRQIPFGLAAEVGLNQSNAIQTAHYLGGQLTSAIQKIYVDDKGSPLWESKADLENLLGNITFNFARVALPVDKPTPKTFLQESGVDKSEAEPETEIEYKLAAQIIDNGSDIPDSIKGFMITVNEKGIINGKGKQEPAIILIDSLSESNPGSAEGLAEVGSAWATLENQIASTISGIASLNPSETLNLQAGTSAFIRNFLYGSQLGGWRGRRRPSKEFPSIPGRAGPEGWFNRNPLWVGWLGRLEAQNPNITLRPQDTLDWKRNKGSWSRETVRETNIGVFADINGELTRMTPGKPLIAYMDKEMFDAKMKENPKNQNKAVMEATDEYMKKHGIEVMSPIEQLQFVKDNFPSLVLRNTDTNENIDELDWNGKYFYPTGKRKTGVGTFPAAAKKPKTVYRYLDE